MKRWHWFSVALLAVVLAAALLAVPRLGGGVERAQAADPSLAIDMVKDTNWCDTDGAGGDNIDATATHAVGDTYEVAICLTDSPDPPTGFNFNLVYDDEMNTCVDTPCGDDAKCLDSNPDINTGVTSSSTPNLGTVGWNCAVDASTAPNCDQNTGPLGPAAGTAFLSCFSGTQVESNLTLPVGAGVSAPIAVLTFHAAGSGTDTLKLDQLSVIRKGGTEIVACSIDDDPNNCSNGTDIKTGATAVPQPTATETPTVGPTATPSCGRAGSGLPTCTPTPKAWTATPTAGPTETATPAPSGGGGEGGNPPPPPPPGGGTGPVVSPPSTGDGSGGVPWATGLMWLMAGLGAISLVSGGLYFRHARMRK